MFGQLRTVAAGGSEPGQQGEQPGVLVGGQQTEELHDEGLLLRLSEPVGQRVFHERGNPVDYVQHLAGRDLLVEGKGMGEGMAVPGFGQAEGQQGWQIVPGDLQPGAQQRGNLPAQGRGLSPVTQEHGAPLPGEPLGQPGVGKRLQQQGGALTVASRGDGAENLEEQIHLLIFELIALHFGLQDGCQRLDHALAELREPGGERAVAGRLFAQIGGCLLALPAPPLLEGRGEERIAQAGEERGPDRWLLGHRSDGLQDIGPERHLRPVIGLQGRAQAEDSGGCQGGEGAAESAARRGGQPRAPVYKILLAVLLPPL